MSAESNLQLDLLTQGKSLPVTERSEVIRERVVPWAGRTSNAGWTSGFAALWRVESRDEAEDELAPAVDWYAEQNPSVAVELADEIRDAVLASSNPRRGVNPWAGRGTIHGLI